ncbi:MAG: endolytic transglycosylase MltG [Clostridia bacterium]|nr:endolytic transglycosylase MltG [Clostridia bacterium]
MARDEFKDYEELLKVFEDDSTAKKPKEDAGNVSLNSQVEHSQSERQKKIDNFKVNINSDSTEKPSRNPGVYFSNPPKDIKRDAQKNKEMPARQRNNADRFRVSAPPITQRQNDLKAAKEAKAKKRSETFFGRLLASENFSKLALMLAVIIFSSVLICIYGINCINDVLAINTDDVAIEVTISEKMSDSEVINTLKDKDLIHNSLFCKIFVKLLDKGGNYVSGVYTLNPNMGIENMLATMQADVTLSETVKLTFPEGWTVDQIAEKLEANKVCTASSFLSTLEMVDFSEEFDFVAAIDNKELRFRMLEGYMYPDTYEFYVGENAASVVRRFLNNFQNRWTTEYQTQADALGVSIDEVIVMASIL